MGRAEFRRAEKRDKKQQTATYNFTMQQLDIMMQQIKEEATDDAINTAMILLLTLPLEVLMDHYWKKTYAKKIPEFTQHVLDYYEMWQDGKLDIDKLKEDLWVYGGIRLEEGVRS